MSSETSTQAWAGKEGSSIYRRPNRTSENPEPPPSSGGPEHNTDAGAAHEVLAALLGGKNSAEMSDECSGQTLRQEVKTLRD